MGEKRGLLGRTIDRLSSSTGAIEDAELRDDAAKAGCSLIASQPDRAFATVHGCLRTVTLRPRGGVAALEATLADGSGEITVVWLGRRRIAGVSPGRPVTVHGRLGQRNGQRVMFNPRYELYS